jgi:DNA-binding NarL/FixJ family response regulator
LRIADVRSLLNFWANNQYQLLPRSVQQELLALGPDQAVLLVFKSKVILRLLANVVKPIFVAGLCQGEKEAVDFIDLHREKVRAIIAGDELADDNSTSLVQRAYLQLPELRTMVIIERPIDVEDIELFNAVIADADLDSRNLHIYKGIMAMLGRKRYRSPGVAIQALECLESRETLKLTQREKDIVRCFARGLSNKEAARELGLSIYTIQTYSADLLAKLEVSNRQKALLKVLAHYGRLPD